jgi:hypothetical protein
VYLHSSLVPGRAEDQGAVRERDSAEDVGLQSEPARELGTVPQIPHRRVL